MAVAWSMAAEARWLLDDREAQPPPANPAAQRAHARPLGSDAAEPEGDPRVGHAGEADLARRFAAGEPGAFEELVSSYQGRVERLAHRLLGWRGGCDVDDAVQDAFLAALTHARRVRGERGIWPWLASVTVNACRTRRRRTWVRERFLATARTAAVAAGVREASPAADLPVESAESLARVRAAVERLGTRHREVIVLHCIEEMRIADVAEVLGVTVNTVNVRLHRARARLREELDRPAGHL